MRLQILLSVALLASACSRSAPQTSADADLAALAELRTRAIAANNTGDVDAWVALFEDSAAYMPPGLPEITTREGLRDVARMGFSASRVDIDIQPVETRLIGEWALERSRVVGRAIPADGGQPVPLDIKQLVVYHRQPDGSWRIARLINNSNVE